MGKRIIDKEFKIEAVRLASEPGNTQAGIERDLGISQGIISRWKRELFTNGEQQAFPGKGHLKPDGWRPCHKKTDGHTQRYAVRRVVNVQDAIDDDVAKFLGNGPMRHASALTRSANA